MFRSSRKAIPPHLNLLIFYLEERAPRNCCKQIRVRGCLWEAEPLHANLSRRKLPWS
jgi:hypothetical protein